MFDTSHLQRHIAEKVAITVLMGTVGWVLLLVLASSSIRGAAITITREVHIGPLVLNTITRQADAGSYTATISFEQGIIWYALFWLVAGVLAGIVASRRIK